MRQEFDAVAFVCDECRAQKSPTQSALGNKSSPYATARAKLFQKPPTPGQCQHSGAIEIYLKS